ncbi:MAG: mechanosensitive ion channel domain-containing protein [Thermodesulfobacteriota bacterium]
MFNFTSQLDDLFLAIYVHLSTNIRDEGVAFLILLLVFLLIIVLQARASKWLSKEGWKYKTYGRFLIGLIFPLIFFLIVKYSTGHLKGPVSQILFTSIAYIYLGYYFIKSLLGSLKIAHIPWNLFSYILLVSAAVFLTVIDLNRFIFKDNEIEEAFYLAYKISLILLVYIVLLSALRLLSRVIPDRKRYLKSLFSNLLGFFSVLYLIVAALWIFRIIGFASSVFVGVVIIFITVILYIFLKTYLKGFFTSKVQSDPQAYYGIQKSSETFLNLLLIYLLYLIFIEFYNLHHITGFLEETYAINTSVIKVSLFSIVSGIFSFLFLLSIVGILKHLIYFLNIKKGNELQAGSFRSLVGNLGLLIVIMVSLSEFGLTWAALLPIAGAIGIGIGIGLQNVMKNYISGIILLFTNRLKIGDIIEIDGNAGRAIGNTLETIYGNVVSIDTFSSVVSTTDGIEVVVPNSQFIDQQMVNYSLSHSNIRMRIPFGVSYGSDPNKVRDILIKVAEENTQILTTPAPNVWFVEYADSAIIFNLLCWVNIRHLWKIKPVISDIYFKAWYKFQEAGVVIPFPQQDVWFKNNLKVEIEKNVGENIQQPEKGEDK